MPLMHAETFVENDAMHRSIMQQVARALRENPAREFTIDQLMKVHPRYCSRFHFSVMFKAVIGTSPIRYHQQQRLKFAKQLIRQGYALDDVCTMIGFSIGSRSRFTVLFTSRIGVSPSVYRLRLMEGIRIIPGVEGPVEPCGGLTRHSDLQI